MSPIFGFEPAAFEPSPLSRAPLMGGDAGVSQTVDVMRSLIDQSMADAQFLRLASDIVRRVASYDDLGEAQAIYSWVKSHIRFTKDPLTKETLFPPMELLKRGAGDCDDISMLMAALDMAVGLPARLVTVAGNPNSPEQFSHVYVEVEAPVGSDNWVPQDAARAGARFGQEPPHYFRKKAWSLSENYSQDLSGYTQVHEMDWPGRRHGLGSYGKTGAFPWLGGRFQPDTTGLGQGSDVDENAQSGAYTGILSQVIQEVPAIIGVSSGAGVSTTTQGGTTAVGPTNPYASFATQYTPGYGIPGAGYAIESSVATNPLLWILGGGLLIFLAVRK